MCATDKNSMVDFSIATAYCKYHCIMWCSDLHQHFFLCSDDSSTDGDDSSTDSDDDKEDDGEL